MEETKDTTTTFLVDDQHVEGQRRHNGPTSITMLEIS